MGNAMTNDQITDYQVGEKVRLTQSIYDDGPDKPPGMVGKKGDVVIIKEIFNRSLAVHHADVTDGSAFLVFRGEFCPTFEGNPA